MQRPYFVRLAAAFVGIAALASSAVAQEPQKAMDEQEAAMMAAYEAAAAPGAAHEKLASMVGNYTLHVKWWADPSAPPELSTSTCKREMIMGGRYLVEHVEGDMMEQPFKGMGLTGYDNLAEQYVATWVDNMGTGIMVMTGNFNEEGKLVMKGTYTDPVTKQEQKMKGVTTIGEDGNEVYEMYMIGDDGKKWKTMEITYEKGM